MVRNEGDSIIDTNGLELGVLHHRDISTVQLQKTNGFSLEPISGILLSMRNQNIFYNNFVISSLNPMM